MLAGALIAFLQAMNLFGSSAILAIPAGFHTMTAKIWSLFQFPPKPELAAAAALPLLVLPVALLRAQRAVLGRRGYAVVGAIAVPGLMMLVLTAVVVALANRLPGAGATPTPRGRGRERSRGI